MKLRVLVLALVAFGVVGSLVAGESSDRKKVTVLFRGAAKSVYERIFAKNPKAKKEVAKMFECSADEVVDLIAEHIVKLPAFEVSAAEARKIASGKFDDKENRAKVVRAAEILESLDVPLPEVVQELIAGARDKKAKGDELEFAARFCMFQATELQKQLESLEAQKK